MADGAVNVEKLVAAQRQVVASFSGKEVPMPPDRLFEVAEKIREAKLFKAEPFYLPRRSLEAGSLRADSRIPGLEIPPSNWSYERITGKGIPEQGADMLPNQWGILDVSRRPDYSDGTQMYADSKGLGEILADLRKQGKIKPSYFLGNNGKVPGNSRFAVSAYEIDGQDGFVGASVAAFLGLQIGERVTAPPYATFDYIATFYLPELGQASTWEWFANYLGRTAGRLYGPNVGRLAYESTLGVRRSDKIGFRLLISFPPQA